MLVDVCIAIYCCHIRRPFQDLGILSAFRTWRLVFHAEWPGMSSHSPCLKDLDEYISTFPITQAHPSAGAESIFLAALLLKSASSM